MMSSASCSILALIFLAVALGGGGADPTRAGLALGAAGLVVVALAGRRLRPLSTAASGLILAWVALGLVWLPTASGPEAGATSALTLLGALCVFAVAHTAVPRHERERILHALGAGGVLIAALALVATVPGGEARFPLATPDRLGAWLALPVVLGVAALCLCAPQGRGARWNIGWFVVVTLAAAGIAATRSVVAASTVGVAILALLALSRLPTRRGLAGAMVIGGLALLSLSPALGAPERGPLAEAGFAPSLWVGGAGRGWVHAAALLLSAGVVLRSVRPLRRGRASLAAWGGLGAVLGIAPLAFADSGLELPAITWTAAAMAGLAWPGVGVATVEDLRRTRAVLLLLCAGVVGALVFGGPWTLALPH